MRAVFFDFGGTLVAPMSSLRPLFEAAARSCGVTISWPELERANEEEWDRLWPEAPGLVGHVPSFADLVHERAFRRVGLHERVDELVAAARAEATSLAWHAPYPETGEVLEALRARGLSVHLVSNNVDYLPVLLRGLGWAGQFGSVTYSQEVGEAKPGGRIFRTALDRAGVAPREAVFVGDSWEADYLGAERAGMLAVWLSRDGRPAPRPARTIRDLRALEPLLDALG